MTSLTACVKCTIFDVTTSVVYLDDDITTASDSFLFKRKSQINYAKRKKYV